MSPLLRSQARRPMWWVRLVEIRFVAGVLLLAVLIRNDWAPHAAAAPQQGNAASPPQKVKKFPAFTEVDEALTDYFKRDGNYQAGDLIARNEVEKFLTVLPILGWNLKTGDQKKLLEKLLPADAFLVEELRTKSGTRFMRRIAKYDGGYDRVHRLTGLKGGEDRLKELIRDPGGYRLIEYMSKSEGGKNLGLMLGNVKGGKDFNSPTGFIYTQRGLTNALKSLHDQYEAELQKGSSRK